MCGSTDAQNQLQQEQLDAYKQAQQMLQDQYGKQQAIYGPMADMFQSIFAKGPSQTGFSDAQLTDLNAGAVEGTAQNYSQAAKAVNENIAAQGGGTNPLPTGAQIQLKSQVAQSAAEEQSREEGQIRQANYQQGYNQWLNAASGLESIAAGDNPLGYQAGAINSGQAAGTTADQIAQEQNSWVNAAIGAAGAIGGGLATGRP